MYASLGFFFFLVAAMPLALFADNIPDAAEYVAYGSDIHLNKDEMIVNDILMKLKYQEIKAGLEDPRKSLPGSNFLSVRKEIENSDVYKRIRMMPKGAALYVHDFGTLSPAQLFQFTYFSPLYLCNEEDSYYMIFLNETMAANEPNCHSIREARRDEKLTQEINAFIEKKLVMMPDNVDTNTAWEKLDSISKFVRPFITYKPVFENYIQRSLLEMLRDNVLYVEMRTSLPELYDIHGNIYRDVQVMAIMKKIDYQFRYFYTKSLGLRVIYAPPKAENSDQFLKYLQIAEQLAEQFPEFLVGVDLLGQEDKVSSLKNYIPDLPHNVPFYFHADEAVWKGVASNDRLTDIILSKAKRIGDGYAVVKSYPLIKVKKFNVTIEVSPISNQVFGLVNDLRKHPVNYLFTNHYPLVISSDKGGFWGAKGLSFDFYETFVGMMSSKADLRALKKLAINSINYSGLSEKEKQTLFGLWEKKWNTFISDTINYYINYKPKQDVN